MLGVAAEYARPVGRDETVPSECLLNISYGFALGTSLKGHVELHFLCCYSQK